MGSGRGLRPPVGNPWGQLGLLAAAGGFGVLLLFTPLAAILVPGVLVIAVIIKLRGQSVDEGPGDGIDQDGAKTNQTTLRSEPADSQEVIEEQLPQTKSFQVAASTEAVPAQASTASPTRRADLFAAAAAKASPTTSSPQQPAFTPSLAISAPLVLLDPAPAAAAAVPPVQLTPTRSLVPAPEPLKEAKASEVTSNALKADPVSAPAPPTESKQEPTAVHIPATGGAAILARFRKQRTDTAKPLTQPAEQPAAVALVPTPSAAVTSAPAAPSPAPVLPKSEPAAKPPPPTPAPVVSAVPVTILFGSQTGTCLEIARNLAAEAVEKGFNATCASLNELGFAALSAARTPVLIVISSSTGDGDPPDNAAAFFVAMRRKPPAGAPPPPPAPLAGVQYTVLGLGDSNYTRFMYVPRSIKGRLAELGAKEFYGCVEADEVEGVENVVDPWTEGLWAALKAAVSHATEAHGKAAAAAEGTESVQKDVAEAAAAKAAAEAAARAAAEKAAAGVAAKAAAEAAAARVAAEKAEAELAAKAAAEKAAAAKAAAEAAESEATAKAAAEAEGATEAAEAAAAEAVTVAEEDAARRKDEEPAAVEGTASEPPPEVPPPEALPVPVDTTPGPPGKAADDSPSPPPVEAPPSSGAAAQSPEPVSPPSGAEDCTSASVASDSGAFAAAAGAASEAAGEPASLLPDKLVEALAASTAPTAATVGLPTIAESRVFEDDPGLLEAAADGETALGDGEASPAAAAALDSRPDSSMSYASGSTATARRHGGNRRSTDMETSRRRTGDKPPSRLQAKPINVNFPKREETVVKRKDEKTYGMLMGLAPVGVDTKGAPPLLPCRIKLSWEKDEGRARGVREQEAGRPTKEERHQVDPQGVYSAEKPFWSHISDARYETAFWSDRKVIHLELSIRGSNMVYEPGDSIGVLPVNHPDLITNLCKRLNLNPDRVFTLQPAAGAAASAAGGSSGGRVASHIPSPCSVGYALSHCVDLTSVTRKSVLRLLAEHATDAAERRTLMYLSSKSQGGKDAYAHEISEHQPSILDLLVRFRSVHAPFEALLDALPPLMPRMYSISSSRRDPARGATHLSVALSVVRFKTRYGTRLGVATTWLDRLAAPFTAEGAVLPEEPIYVPIFLRRAADFKLPPSLATPLVMVGPGTGVAPFRGFLQERRAQILAQKPAPELLGEAVLFFGCRRDDEDYLYKEELEAFKVEGTLAALHVAFSRAQADKVYVQDLIKQQGAKVWALLQAGAHVYVCGDGVAMSKDVHAALAGVVQQYGGLSEQDATAFLQNLAQERRYVRDVWS